MDTTTRKTIRCILFLAALFLLVSCRMKDEPNDARFLWFIPVAVDMSLSACVSEILCFGVALLVSVAVESPGLHSKQIRRAIRDKDGQIVGYYDTGEVETWYVSEEEAEQNKVRAKRAGRIIRLVALTCVSWGIVISWIFPAWSVWFFLFGVPICGFRIYENIKHLEELELVWLWEKVFLAICIICTIVYALKA
ncbi:MAG: hypothetical protein IKI66_04950 [Bacteroidales bacterium]|nr:hypothetical protein [Bacteroidales bacterium]